MANHPNRSQSRPVVQSSVQAEILGLASNEDDALAILNEWARVSGVGAIESVKLSDVLLIRDHPRYGRTCKAWLPA